MIPRPARALVSSAVLLLAVAGCGKKGNPLPPLRPLPSRILDLTAHRVDNRVELRFTVPANADGSTPPAVTRVDIYRVALQAGAPPLPPAQVLSGARDPIATVRVRPPASEPTAAPAQTPAEPTATTGRAELPAPAAGERATFVDLIDPARLSGAATWSYVAVPVAGSNRRGPVSGAVHVPLGDPPPPPTGLKVAATEDAIKVTWDPVLQGQTVNVVSVADAPSGAEATVLSPKPLATAEFTTAVEFGKQRCFALRTVVTASTTTTEGPPSDPVCVTPVDVYPPPAPTGLQAIQEGAFITLNWTSVEARDLGGYIVLRGGGDGTARAPLVREPAKETTFTDRTAQAGMTYTYTVYAVDTAPTPNVSEQSSAVTVTVR